MSFRGSFGNIKLDQAAESTDNKFQDYLINQTSLEIVHLVS